MSHVFISYSRTDGKPYAEQLDATLPAKGYTTWRDKRGIDPSQDFSAEIEKAIERARVVVACITDDTRRDDSFVRREISYALIDKKPLIVARFANVKPPIQVVNHTWIDFFNGWDAALEQLLDNLRQFDADGHYEPPPPSAPADPYRDYLNALYKRIVEYFKRALITQQQIDLFMAESPDAVKSPPRKSAVAAPDMVDQFFTALPWYVPTEEAPPAALPQFKTFNAAFAHFEGRMLLLGEPGAGKTITLMAHAREAVAARLDDPTQPLPLLGVIATWDAQKQTPLAEWLTPRDLTTAQIEREIAQGRALLLLDGLDELGRERPVDPQKPDGEKYDPRARFVAQIPANNQILITCRVQDYADLTRKSGEKLALNSAVTLQALTDEQLQLYLHDQRELWDALQADATLKEVARTPLLLSLFAFTYNKLTPDERADLLQLENAGEVRDKLWLNYIRLRYAHEERRKTMDITVEDLYQNLRMIAAYMYMQTWRMYTSTPAYELRKVEIEHFMPIDLTVIDICQVMNFLVKDSNGSIRFITKQMGEWLAKIVLLELLASDDVEMRFGAARGLGLLNDKNAVPALLKALKVEPDPFVRHAIHLALERLKPEYTIFISHRRKDWGITFLILEHASKKLEANFFIDRFIDETDFEANILKNLLGSQVLLLVCTESTFAPDLPPTPSGVSPFPPPSTPPLAAGFEPAAAQHPNTNV